MTTHDERTTAPVQPAQPEFSNAQVEPVLSHDASPAEADESRAADTPTNAAPVQPEPTVVDDQSSPAHAEPASVETVPQSAEVQPSEELLFAADASGLRSRWDDIQASFVDDPADCVQKADTLVTEVVDQLTAAFSDARSRLEAQWARGEQASTEDLRLALQRYREFFQRLLTV